MTTPAREPEAHQGTALSDQALDEAIAAQRAAASVEEQALARARDRFDRARRSLRALEQERERRRLAAAGVEPPVTPERARRRRSTTGIDALLGRDGIEPDLPFSHFRVLSLKRQDVYLNHTGNRAEQALTLTERGSGAVREARTFGEAKRLQEQGFALGRPDVPLQRQAIWYVEDGKAGWLRLDQLFVEREEDGE